MADHGEAKAIASDPFRRPCGFEGAGPEGRPFCPAVPQLPFEEITERARRDASRVEEDVAVEMVACRTGIVRITRHRRIAGYLAARPGEDTGRHGFGKRHCDLRADVVR